MAHNLNPYSTGIDFSRQNLTSVDFSRQNLTSVDVRFWRLKSIPDEETFCFFETWMAERGSNPRSPTFQVGNFNHCTRAPALYAMCRYSNYSIRAVYMSSVYNVPDFDAATARARRMYSILTLGALSQEI